MNDYTMPVKAIKNILQSEFEGHKQGFYNAYPKFIMSDMQKEIISEGYSHAMNQLADCTTHEELDSFIGYWYRMSLNEWINSL